MSDASHQSLTAATASLLHEISQAHRLRDDLPTHSLRCEGAHIPHLEDCSELVAFLADTVLSSTSDDAFSVCESVFFLFSLFLLLQGHF
jgi:transcriptional regulator of aromatic amino acid metabolism